MGDLVLAFRGTKEGQSVFAPDVSSITLIQSNQHIKVVYLGVAYSASAKSFQLCPTLCNPITNFQSLLKLMSITSVMPSKHLILCHPLLLSPLIFPSIRVFSNKLVLHTRCPKCWSISFSISPSNKFSGLISFRIDWQTRNTPKC